MNVITHHHGDVWLVTLHGQFTFVDNAEFKRVMEAIDDPAIKQIVLHFEHVDFIDSAALGMLIMAHDAAAAAKKSLLLKGVNGQVKRVFTMARFDQFFTIA